MKIKTVEFLREVKRKADLIKEPLPEIAFAGRSNVGKSSLINTLLGRKIAKTSQTPGKTRGVNYMKVNGEFFFVDLPGYGYAKVNKNEKALWGSLIEHYVGISPNLKLVICIIDCRRDLMDADVQLFEWLGSLDRDFLIALSKSDKLSRSKLNLSVLKISSYFKNTIPVLPFSSLKKEGKNELWQQILTVM